MVRNITTSPLLVLAAVVVALALVIGASVWPSGQADADGHSAMRSLSSDSVAPGDEITVTIDAANLDSFGQVVETLPEGFSYVANSTSPSNLRTKVTGQEVRFTILGASESFTYKVTASDMAGSYTFMGAVTDGSAESRDIPDTDVTVTAAPGPSPEPSVTTPIVPSNRGATRSLSPTTVAPGGEVIVTIAANYGPFGQVVETLPEGFSYVAGSVDPASVRVAEEEQKITFTLLGDATFSYTVMASLIGGRHTMGGTLQDDEGNSYAVREGSVVTVDAPVPTATRRLPSRVNPGATLTVNIRVTNYGDFGQVVETLPDGFAYVPDSASPSDVRVAEDGQMLTFTFFGTDSFSYRVTAPAGTGAHTFGGVLMTDQGGQITVGGDFQRKGQKGIHWRRRRRWRRQRAVETPVVAVLPRRPPQPAVPQSSPAAPGKSSACRRI